MGFKLIVTSGIINLILFLIGFLVGKYLKPWLAENTERYNRAKELGLIADDITDAFVSLYPNNPIAYWFNKAVDKFLEAAGLPDRDDTRELAERLVRASYQRKYGNKEAA
ncbi:hypothetical protein J7K18_03450 [bacterium]|nr:hypothetical protein [bacterium]